jgi:potassium efflux system protein
MIRMKICRRFFLILMLLAPLVMVAQDTADRQRADSGRRWRQDFFTDTSQYNSSDYQVQIEKTFAALDNINRHAVVGNSFDKTAQKLQENDSILAVIQESLESNSRALNLRNLQVFRTLLLHMQEDLSRRFSWSSCGWKSAP